MKSKPKLTRGFYKTFKLIKTLKMEFTIKGSYNNKRVIISFWDHHWSISSSLRECKGLSCILHVWHMESIELLRKLEKVFLHYTTMCLLIIERQFFWRPSRIYIYKNIMDGPSRLDPEKKKQLTNSPRSHLLM